MENHKLGRAPNYTNACIILFGVNLTWVLLCVLAIWGIGMVVLLGLIVNHWLTWLEARKQHPQDQ